MQLLGNIICLLIYIFLIIWFYNRHMNIFFISLLFFFFHLWMMISVLFLETGVYINDYLSSSFYTGSTIRLFILEIIFLFTYSWTLSYFERKKARKINYKIMGKNSDDMKIWLFIISIGTCILLINLILSGNVFTNSNITRFNFYTNYSILGIATYVEMILLYLQLVNGMIFVKSIDNKLKIYRNFSIINFIFALFYKLAIGIEFGGFLYLLVFFSIPYFSKHTLGRINIFHYSKKVIRVIFFSIIALIIMAIPKFSYFTTSTLYQGSATSAFGRFLHRAFALQGEVWWKIDFLKINGNLENQISQFYNEGLAIINDSNKTSSGMWYLMDYVFAPEKKINYIEEPNLTLTNGFPAINISMFGYSGTAILQILLAFIFGGITYYLFRKVSYNQYFRAFFASICFYQIYQVVYVGGYWFLGGKLFIISSITLVILDFIFPAILRSNQEYKNIIN